MEAAWPIPNPRHQDLMALILHFINIFGMYVEMISLRQRRSGWKEVISLPL
jgi:hypothetical protein